MKEENPYSFYALMLILLAMLIGGWHSCGAQVNSFPHLSSFELGFGDWRNSESDDFNWSHINGSSTPSAGTGPQIGPPFGGKNTDGYVHIESSSPNYPNMEAWLELSVDFSMLLAPEINFSYQMYASNGPGYGPGILQLDIYDGSTWIYNVWSNDVSDINWQAANIDLSPYAGQPFVILSWTGFSIWWQSDICLDEIIIQDKGGALPIELLSFNATTNDLNNVVIEWSTASQVNNDYFTIERSLDCENWKEVVKINGVGNANTQIDYAYIDRDPYIGLSYYRLKQTDYDEVFEIFDPVSVTVKDEMTIGLKIKPNPAINHIDLEMVYPETGNINSDIRIYNTLGDEVYKKFYMGKLNHINIDISKYKPGLYIVKSKLNHKSVQAKFIKEPEN